MAPEAIGFFFLPCTNALFRESHIRGERRQGTSAVRVAFSPQEWRCGDRNGSVLLFRAVRTDVYLRLVGARRRLINSS
jgi:hypothetical protein